MSRDMCDLDRLWDSANPHPDTDAGAHTLAHVNVNTVLHPDTNADTYTARHVNTVADAHADFHVDTNAVQYANGNTYASANRPG